MKTIKFFYVAVFATFVLFSSCSKGDDTKPNDTGKPTEIPVGTIRAKVDGVLKTADKFVLANISPIKLVQLSGTGGPNNNILQFNLAIGDFTGKGTYDLGVYDSYGLGVNARFFEASFGGYSCTPNLPETSGKLVVTEYTEGKSMKGTFQFKGKKEGTAGSGGAFVNITDGEFNIALK